MTNPIFKTLAPLAVLFSAGCACEAPPPLPLGPNIEILREIKLTQAARIPQNDPSFSSVEAFENRLVFHYSKAPTVTLEPGNVVAGNTEGGYLRKLKTVSVLDERTIEVTTDPAELVDVILDGAFRVRHHPEAQSWQAGEVRSRRDPIETKLGIMPPGTKSGLQCGAAGALPVEIDPSFVMDMDFELAIDIEAESYIPPRGRLVSALFAVTGEVTVGLDVTSSVAVSGQCTIDIIKFLRDRAGNKDLFKFKLPDIKFALGPLPIIITNAIEPTLSIQASLNWTTQGMLAHKEVTYRLRTGAQYVNGGWEGIWEPDRFGKASMNQTGEGGTVSFSTQLAAGVQFIALVYDAAGPKIAIEGTVEGKFAASPTTCAWSVTSEAGVNVVLGAEIQVPAIDYKLVDYTQTFNLIKGELSKIEGTFAGCITPIGGGGGGGEGGGSGGGQMGGGAGGGGGGDMRCTTMDPTLDDARTVLRTMALESFLVGSCLPLDLLILLHSSTLVGSKAVAHDHTTSQRVVAMRALLQAAQVSQLFNTTPQFPCGMGPNGFTLCPTTVGAMPAGDYFVLSNVFEGAIPLSDPMNYYQYGFVFDSDGITTNNYQPSAPYLNDFFKDTDRWYTADYSPMTRAWTLKVVDARGGMFTTVTNSSSRIVMQGNSLTLVVPRSEFTSMDPGYRLSAFRHPGNYGTTPPYDYDGSLSPSVAEGLRPIF